MSIANCAKCNEEKITMCYMIESWRPTLERGPGKAFLSKCHLS